MKLAINLRIWDTKNCLTLKSKIGDDNLNFILEEEKFDFVFRVNQGKQKYQ